MNQLNLIQPQGDREYTPDELLDFEVGIRRNPQRAELRTALGQALHATVRALLARGNYAQADLMALMALQCAVPDLQSFFTYRQQIASALGIDLAKPPVSSRRYLVIRAWGAGFWSEVDHLLGQLLLSEVTLRQPIVHWGENCLYGGTPTENGLEHYFDPVGEPLAALLVAPHDIYPRKWTIDRLGGPDINKKSGEFSKLSAMHFLGRQEPVLVSDHFTQILHLASWIPSWHPMHKQPLAAIYGYLTGKYLRPRIEHQQAADQFVQSTFKGRPFLALHLRGLDKVAEVRNLAQGNQACLDQTDELLRFRPDLGIFLLTDDESLLDAARRRYGARIATTESRRALGLTGLHFQVGTDQNERISLGREVMLDSLVALRANYLVGLAPSNLAAMIGCLRAWPQGSVFLLGKSQHEELNLALNDDTVNA